MSLSSHLADKTSPIGQFLHQRFALTANITKAVNPMLRAGVFIQPPTQASEPYPYGTIGHAIDYRIRYSFAVTPSRQTVAYLGARALAHLMGNFSPTITKRFVSVLDDFFDVVDADVSSLQPVGRPLAIGDEQELARYCFVLGLFEEIFRSGTPSERLLRLTGRWNCPESMVTANQGHFIGELLAIPKVDWVEDICRMASLFLERNLDLLKQPALLNPTFAGSTDVGGADADLIVNNCLIDLKSSKRPGIDPLDLRQLAGYVLLDYEDRFHIHSVGIYKARYGMLLSWPLEQFVVYLSGDTAVSIQSLRADFQRLCHCYRQ